MKKRSLIYSVFLFGSLLLSTSIVYSQQPEKKKDEMHKQVSEYTCPMHPEVKADKPGKCPKCGMELVKKEHKPMYTCSMHPEVKSDKPGKCPKCGMDLVKVNHHDKDFRNDSTMEMHHHMHDSTKMKMH